jgi:hypothetical protein
VGRQDAGGTRGRTLRAASAMLAGGWTSPPAPSPTGRGGTWPLTLAATSKQTGQ